MGLWRRGLARCGVACGLFHGELSGRVLVEEQSLVFFGRFGFVKSTSMWCGVREILNGDHSLVSVSSGSDLGERRESRGGLPVVTRKEGLLFFFGIVFRSELLIHDLWLLGTVSLST